MPAIAIHQGSPVGQGSSGGSRTVAFTDADLSYAPSQLEALLAEVEAGWDVVVGSRAHSANPHRIPWDAMDLSDPEHPRLTCTIDELKQR